MPKLCDQRTVGVLITDDRDRLLMITRNTAPVAGHQDLTEGADHGGLHTAEDAARAEVAEEVGLSATRMRPLLRDVWVPTWCRRTLPAGATEHGHRWTVYRAEAAGDLAPDDRETRGAAWYTPEEVGDLARATLAYARGQMSDEQWQREPGLEPVWVELLHLTRRLPVLLLPGDLALVRRLYTTPPESYWLEDRLVDAATVARDRVRSCEECGDTGVVASAWEEQGDAETGPVLVAVDQEPCACMS